MTFTGTLVNVGNLRRNSGECQGGSRKCGAVVRQTSPDFAKVRMKACACLRYTLETCLIADFRPAKSKRGREEGDGTENVISWSRRLSQIAVTFYDEFYGDL